jgi:O-antigen ligase
MDLINYFPRQDWPSVGRLDTWTLWFLFLLPLFAVSVRHWLSSLFTVLCLLGIVNLFRRKNINLKITREEWLLMALFAAFFISFVLTAFLLGWDEHATRALGTEFRFLLFIPLYLLVRQQRDALMYLAWGCLFAVLLNFLWVAYEVEFFNIQQVHGVYSSLYLGPITVIFASVALFVLGGVNYSFAKYLPVALILATGYVAVYTSRSALVAVAILLLFYFYAIFSKYRLAMLLLMFTAFIAVVLYNPFVNSRMQSAHSELVAYLSHEFSDEAEINPHGGSSVGVRLEMIKASKFVLQDYPWFGFGRYGYQEYMSGLVDKGLLNPEVANHGHPHNMLLSALFFKGLFGLLIVILIFALAFKRFSKIAKDHKTTSFAGMAFLLVLLVTQMTESATLIKGNFISVFLVFLAVLFASKRHSLVPGMPIISTISKN